jgi:large subunit ribosomal protein L3
MPQEKRPKRGGRGFYPKKRAARIYPAQKFAKSKEAKPLGFAAYKAGMTHIQVLDTNQKSRTKNQLVTKAVSVLECPPLTVFGYRLYRKTVHGIKTVGDVYAEKFDKCLERKITIKQKQGKKIQEEGASHIHLLCHTNPVFKKTPETFEIAVGGSISEQAEAAKQLLGKSIKISDVFKPGDYVDVSSVSKGKGFQGPVKRFGIRLHGRKMRHMHRHVGSLGGAEPGKVRPTVPAAGQLGFQTRTELNKRILKIVEPKEINPKGGFPNFGIVKTESVLMEGTVPGSRKRLIRLRVPMRPPISKYPVEIKYISLESKQG